MKKRISLVLILLVYLSGRFTLYRLGIASAFQIRYILIILLILSLLIPTYRISRIKIKFNKSIKLFISVMIVFSISTLFAVFYSPDKVLALEKYLDILFMLTLLLFTFYISNLFTYVEYFKIVGTFFILIGVIYSIPIIISSISIQGRGTLSLGGPNVATRILFFSLISSIYFYLSNGELKFLLLSIIYSSAIILVGSRGGLVAAVVSLCNLYLFKYRSRYKISNASYLKKIKVKHLLYFLIGLVVAFLLYDIVANVFINRYIKQTFVNGDVYSAGRENFYLFAINMIFERPMLGHGLNSFDYYSGLGYPHNLLLELMSEIGLIGLVFFICIFLGSTLIFIKYRKTSIYPFSILPLYMVVVQMFSGDLYDFRYWILWLTPLIYYIGKIDLIDIRKISQNT